MNNQSAEVIVVGAGIAGLTAAAFVARGGRSVQVIESRDQPGGQARSDDRDGFALNLGPHALYNAGEGSAILKQLGITVTGSPPTPANGQMMFDGQLQLAPAGPATLLRTKSLSVKEKVEIGRVLGRLSSLRAGDYASVSTQTWIDGVVRSERARQMISAVVRVSSYGNRPVQMSAEVAISQAQISLSHGVTYLDGGWSQLVRALTACVPSGIVVKEAVRVLPEAAAVIVATGNPKTAGELVGRQFAVGPSLEVSCLDLGLRRRPPHNFVLGGDVPFYFSNFSAAANVAAPGQHLVCVAEYLNDSSAPSVGRLEEYARATGIPDDDVVMRRYLHRMTAVSAVATAEHGGLHGRPAVTDSGVPGVFLAGDWVGPAGHLADASFASGRSAGLAALHHLEHRSIVR